MRFSDQGGRDNSLMTCPRAWMTDGRCRITQRRRRCMMPGKVGLEFSYTRIRITYIWLSLQHHTLGITDQTHHALHVQSSPLLPHSPPLPSQLQPQYIHKLTSPSHRTIPISYESDPCASTFLQSRPRYPCLRRYPHRFNIQTARGQRSALNGDASCPGGPP